jgi:hypothetical protein
MGQYLLNILVAFDRMINAIISGDPDETLSSVAFRKNRDEGKWKFTKGFINKLFFNPNHCNHAYDFDRNRKLKP